MNVRIPLRVVHGCMCINCQNSRRRITCTKLSIGDLGKDFGTLDSVPVSCRSIEATRSAEALLPFSACGRIDIAMAESSMACKRHDIWQWISNLDFRRKDADNPASRPQNTGIWPGESDKVQIPQVGSATRYQALARHFLVHRSSSLTVYFLHQKRRSPICT